MEEHSLEERVRALERVVFAEQSQKPSKPPLFSSVYGVEYTPPRLPQTGERTMKTSAELSAELRDWIRGQMPEDTYVVHAIVGGSEQEPIDSFQMTGLEVVQGDAADGDVAALCNALGSKQRVSILRILSAGAQASGDLVEFTGMAGGHLHHHIRELAGLKLIYKNDEGLYQITPKGLCAYLTVAAMYRYLFTLARHR